jgi:hypothetical protein
MLKRVLAAVLWMAVGCQVLAQPAPADTRALMAALEAEMDGQQAALEAALRAADARARWSGRDRALFFQSILRAQPAAANEQRIAALTAELRNMQQALRRGEVKGAQADQRFVARLRELVIELRALQARQSAYLIERLLRVGPTNGSGSRAP